MMPRTRTVCFWLIGGLLTLPAAANEGSTEKHPVSVDGPILMTQAQVDADAPDASPSEPDGAGGPRLAPDGTATAMPLPATKDDASPVIEHNPAADVEKVVDAPSLAPRELPAELAPLRDRVRRTLAYHFNQPLSAEGNSVGEVINACRAFGCRTEVLRGGKRINAVTCLCWNYACGGFEPLTMIDGKIVARVGYGRQDQPGQMLAVFALARLPADYPMRVGEEVRRVADFVEQEKLSCRSDTDLSLKLTGLSFYVEAPWTNDIGEQWSIERMVEEEMAKPIVHSIDGGMPRLMALSAALVDRSRRQEPLDGQYARAAKFTQDFQDFAFTVQNSDGGWSPSFLAERGSSRDPAAQLRSCGRILEWLAFSLPEDRLVEPATIKAVEYVTALLGTARYQGAAVRTMNSRELASVMHALHALALYDERVFKPADPTTAEAPAAERAAPTR
jgi:hypothetical protein